MTRLIYQPFVFLIWRNRGKKLDHVLTSVDFALVKERKEGNNRLSRVRETRRNLRVSLRRELSNPKAVFKILPFVV